MRLTSEQIEILDNMIVDMMYKTSAEEIFSPANMFIGAWEAFRELNRIEDDRNRVTEKPILENFEVDE